MIQSDKVFKIHMFQHVAMLSMILLVSGCSIAKNLEEIKTLKSVANSHDEMADYVAKRDKQFEALLQLVKADDLADFESKRDFEVKFGQPIAVKKVKHEGITVDRWLYRYSLEPIDSDKVYLTFNTKDKLLKTNLVIAPKKPVVEDIIEDSNSSTCEL
jgi:hypothetical protein